MSADYQAVVIGGGPSGARIAQRLAAGGASVLLLEAEGPDVDNLCSGLLNREGQHALGCELPAQVRREPFAPELEFHDADNRLRRRYDPGYWNMDRRSFDAWLRECAAEAGADVQYHRRAGRIEHCERCASVHVGGDTIRANVLLDASGWRALSRKGASQERAEHSLRPNAGAGGAAPVLRKADGPSRNSAPTKKGGINASPTNKAPHVHAFQGVIESPDLPEGSMWAVFQSAVTPYYGWLVPKGGGRFLLGAGYPQGSAATRRGGDDAQTTDANPWRKLEYLIDYVRRQGYSLELIDGKPLGCPITTIERTAQLWWGNGAVVPVGEAAGLVSPSSGDGIHFGLEHANALAELLLVGDALHTGLDIAGHAELTTAVQRRLRAALSELRFNCIKAAVAARPLPRGIAARLLPLYLRRPVQRLAAPA